MPKKTRALPIGAMAIVSLNPGPTAMPLASTLLRKAGGSCGPIFRIARRRVCGAMYRMSARVRTTCVKLEAAGVVVSRSSMHRQTAIYCRKATGWPTCAAGASASTLRFNIARCAAVQHAVPRTNSAMQSEWRKSFTCAPGNSLASSSSVSDEPAPRSPCRYGVEWRSRDCVARKKRTTGGTANASNRSASDPRAPIMLKLRASPVTHTPTRGDDVGSMIEACVAVQVDVPRGQLTHTHGALTLPGVLGPDA
eukprot:2888781-Prymnesium_polylepis.1